MNNRIRYLIIAVCAAPFIYVIGMGSYLFLTTPESECAVSGFGKTPLHGTVTDKITHQRISDFQVTVRYGMSGDVLIDSVFATDGDFHWPLHVDNDCEPYWLRISHPNYWDVPDGSSYYTGLDIKKGKTNTYTLQMEPASRLHYTIRNTFPDTDSLWIEVINTKTHEVAYTDTYFFNEYQPQVGKKPMHKEIQLRIRTPYQIRCVRASSAHDTLLYSFTTKIQDTTTCTLPL